MNFMEFAEDVQLTILSFLTAADVSALAATSRRSRSLCRPESRLWHALSHRRWGRLTQLHRWAPATASSFHNRSLACCVHLVGFWRRIFSPSFPLLFFDWVPSFVAGSRLSPAGDGGGYGVAKTPFLWMGVSPGGEPVNFLDPDRRIVDFAKVGEKWVFFELAGFGAGTRQFCREEPFGGGRKSRLRRRGWDKVGGGHFEGRRRGSSRGGDGGDLPVFRQPVQPRLGGSKGRRGRGKGGWRRVGSSLSREGSVNCSPTPSRPLQGLWKVLILRGCFLAAHNQFLTDRQNYLPAPLLPSCIKIAVGFPPSRRRIPAPPSATPSRAAADSLVGRT